jgi:ubiquinone/menaquinone biosynthesis C-methylase UbiE
MPVDIDRKLELEQQWHESEDFARDDNSLIVGVYASGVFAEAEAWHLAALGDVAGQHVLDYGCGTGGTTAHLLERGARVTGFNISVARLLEARQRAPQAGLLSCAAEMLPFPDAAFDAVLGKQILHHLDLRVAIPEIARVLRPGGRAVFLEPLIHNPILEGYHRLTPHLRSPTERALSMADLAWMGSHFSSWSHREFILFSILPVLVEALSGWRGALAGVQQAMQRADRALLDAVPWVGRYCWETVIVLAR